MCIRDRFAPAIGAAASAVGSVIMWATELQPLLMGILVSVLVGIALTLPISSAAICAALNLTGLAAVSYTHLGSCCLRKQGLVVYLIMLWHIPIFQQLLSPVLSFHFRTDQ